jgi:hypothetical protein
MGLSEAETQANLINPPFYAWGWIEDLIRQEETAGTIEVIEGNFARVINNTRPIPKAFKNQRSKAYLLPWFGPDEDLCPV